MKAGIFGPQGSGKTTLFKAMTGMEPGKSGIGVVKVKDPRISALSELFKPKKTTFAEVDFEDLGNPQKRGRSGVDNEFVERLGKCDILVLTLGAFFGTEDPVADFHASMDELILTDLAVTEKTLQRWTKERRSQQELDALNTKLTSLQTTYANLLASTQGGANNTLEIIEKAPLPIHPIGPNKLLTILGAAFGGLMLSVIGAYGVEYLDDRLKTPTDIERAIPHPVLAHIPYVPHETHPHTYMAQNPRSPTADAFRSLRNNLGFLAEPPFRTILVSSAMPGEGKSTVATNLALSLSHAGYRVVLVDADLRAPSIFSALDLSGKPGLSDILKGDTPLTECINTLPDYGIDVIVSGAEHEQSTELLVSRAMQSTLDALLETYDVVVIDGPPFAIPDAIVLSRRVDGILWVTRTNASRRTAIRLMQKQIAQTQTRVFGVVINGGRDMHTRYYQAYGYSHYYQHENGHRNGNGHKKPRWKFPEWKKIPERKKSQQKS